MAAQEIRLKPPAAARWLLPTVSDVLFICFFLGILLRERGPARFLLSEDTGWHLLAGRLIVSERRVPEKDVFSYTMAGAPWVAYEYLSEIAMAGAEELGGLTGVGALAAAAIAGTIAGLYRIMRRQGSSLAVSLSLALLAVLPLSVHWLARPHLASMLLILIFVDRLDRYVRGIPARVWTLPLWTLLWVQLHGGFLLGFILLAAVTGGVLLEKAAGRPGARPLRPLVGIGLSMAAVSFIHPDGLRLHRYIFRYLSSGWIFDHNLEFRSPDFHEISIQVFGLWLFLFVVVAALGRYRPRPSEMAAPVAFAALALHSARHIPYAVIAGAPLLARMLEAALPQSRLRELLERAGHLERTLRGGIWASASVVAVVFLVASRLWERADLPALGFHPQVFPVEASSYLERASLPDRMFNSDNWGGYLIYRLYPRHRVFIDGRQDMYGEGFVRAYWDTARGGRGWEKSLARHRVEWVIWPADEPLSALLAESRSWELLYQDRTARIFMRRKEAGGR